MRRPCDAESAAACWRQILVDFSRRKAEPGEAGGALRPALPFFRRRTVKNRIRELLEEASVERWSAPLSTAVAGGVRAGRRDRDRTRRFRRECRRFCCSAVSGERRRPATCRLRDASDQARQNRGSQRRSVPPSTASSRTGRPERNKHARCISPGTVGCSPNGPRHSGVRGRRLPSPRSYSGRVSYWSEGTDRLRRRGGDGQ